MNELTFDVLLYGLNGVLVTCIIYFLKVWKESIKEDFNKIFKRLEEFQVDAASLELKLEQKHNEYSLAFAPKSNLKNLTEKVDTINHKIFIIEGIIREREHIYDNLFTKLLIAPKV